ncbi:MAG: hypothetical protein ACOYNY_46595 [Caldilineaceae bacterium]
MPQHDFTQLYAQYPAVLDQLPGRFSSHEFILQLAQQHQALYVEALYSYRNTIHRGKAAPFQIVHAILAMRLTNCTDRIRQLSPINSQNIFGESVECAAWEKI